MTPFWSIHFLRAICTFLPKDVSHIITKLVFCLRSGTIDIYEFAALWKYIQEWKGCFERFVLSHYCEIHIKDYYTVHTHIVQLPFLYFSSNILDDELNLQHHL